MKVVFIRHGEALDDVENRYGGWYDPALSPKGLAQAKETAQKLKEKNFKVDLILSSPLRRAVQTAEIISQTLSAPMQTLVYLKERNTYGLLCGENKDQAKEKYPELVKAYEKGEEVSGYEEYQFFLKRVRVMLKKLAVLPNESIICVTHGKMLKAIFEDILKIKVAEFHDNCLAETSIDQTGKLSLTNSEGIDF